MEVTTNRASILERFDGDWEVFNEVATLFIEEYPRLIESIREAIRLGNPAHLNRAAHTFKGSVSNFSPGPAAPAFELERMGEESNLDGAEEAMARLEKELALVIQEIRRMQEEGPG